MIKSLRPLWCKGLNSVSEIFAKSTGLEPDSSSSNLASANVILCLFIYQSVPFEKRAFEVLAISVYKWGLPYLFLSAVMRIKQDKIYETYKAKIIKHGTTLPMSQASTFPFLSPYLLPSFMSFSQWLPWALRSQWGTNIYDHCEPVTHTQCGLPDDKQTTESMSKVMSRGDRCSEPHRTSIWVREW